MSVTTLSAQQASNSLSVPQNTYTNLLPQASVTGTGNLVEIKANVYGLDPAQVQTRILIDGNEITIADNGAGTLTVLAETLSSGTHTIDFQAYSFITGQTAGERFMTVINLA